MSAKAGCGRLGGRGTAAALLSILVLACAAGLPRASGASGESGDPALLQRCLSAALLRPKVVRPPRMIRAGIWPNTGFRYEQAVVGALGYGAMPEECAGRYARISGGDVQMLRKGRWVTTRRSAAGWAGGEGGTARVITGGGHPDDPRSAFIYNACMHGRFHKVRLRVVTSLTRPALGTTEGRREWRLPVPVHGSCSRAAVSAKRVRKLQHELFGTPL